MVREIFNDILGKIRETVRRKVVTYEDIRNYKLIKDMQVEQAELIDILRDAMDPNSEHDTETWPDREMDVIEQAYVSAIGCSLRLDEIEDNMNKMFL